MNLQGYREAIAGVSMSPTVTQIFFTFSLLSSYIACLAFYRLFLSPLARIPGPKIAGTHYQRLLLKSPFADSSATTALTSLYAGYHDLYRRGQYVWVIQEMHKKYGKLATIFQSWTAYTHSAKVQSFESDQTSSMSTTRILSTSSTLTHQGSAARNTKQLLTCFEPLVLC